MVIVVVPSSEEVKELRQLLALEPHIQKKEVPIFDDGAQLSIRIPRKFADAAGIDSESVGRFLFKFVLRIPEKTDEPVELTGEVIKVGDKAKPDV